MNQSFNKEVIRAIDTWLVKELKMKFKNDEAKIEYAKKIVDLARKKNMFELSILHLWTALSVLGYK